MARRLDQALIIDVESTCWDHKPPAGEVSEIIEIGLARVDLATLERIDKRAILVRPQKSNVSRLLHAAYFAHARRSDSRHHAERGVPRFEE